MKKTILHSMALLMIVAALVTSCSKKAVVAPKQIPSTGKVTGTTTTTTTTTGDNGQSGHSCGGDHSGGS